MFNKKLKLPILGQGLSTLGAATVLAERHHGGIQACINRALAVHQACVFRAFTHAKCIVDAWDRQG